MKNNRTIFITQSELKTFINCRKRHFFAYVEKLIPTEKSAALVDGQAYHEEVSGESNSEDVRIIAMKKAYDKLIKPMLKEHKPEHEYQLHLGYGVYLCGKIDGVGNNFIVEHKTARIIDNKYWWRLRLDFQIDLYLLSQSFNRCVYTVIQKPSIKQKKNETIEEYGQRCIEWYDDSELNFNKAHVKVEIRSNEQLNKSKLEALQIAKEIRSCKNYYRNPQACSIFQCPYESICLDYENALNFGFEKKTQKHEELNII